ncbi:MAG: adenylate/guanylate cyclase domain-containing protein, partial [Chloroflexota bacterium]
HDRIQHAVYSLLTASEREETHYQIGQILWQHPEQDSHLFELVNHFNQAKAIIHSKQEEKKLAALNYRAAQKAYDSAAFSVAFTYMQMTLALIPDGNWQTAYRETLDQHVLAAKTAYLSNEFTQMDALVNIILERATSTLDKMYAYEVRILAHVTQLEPIKALQITKEALAQLNIKLPENPGRLHILYELLHTRFHLRGQAPADLANLPEMRDPETLMVIRLISQVLSSAFRAAPATFLLFVFRIIRLSLAHGNAPLSAFAYACYGLVLCGVTGNIDTGYQFGELAHTLQQTFQARDIQAKIAMVRMTFIKHWKDPLPDCLPPLVAGYQAGMDTGDFEFASFNLYIETLIDYVIGRPLPEVAQKSAVNLQTIKELQQKSAQHFIEIYWQAALNLMGEGEMEGEDPIELLGPIYDERVTLPKQIAANDRTGVGNVYLQKLFLSYLFYQYDQALENAQKFDEYKESARGAPNMPRFLFYRSLTSLAVAGDNPANKKTLLRQVKKDLKQLSKWSKFGPNYRHYVYLLQAEWSHIHTDFNQAAKFYDKAIHHTREYNLLHEEGVANELAARFYLNQGREKVAFVYLTDARYAYLRWGANAKVAHLEAHYPALAAQLAYSIKTTATLTPQSSSTAYSTDSTTGSRQGATSLDIHSVMKASQAISGEIVLETLLQKLMRTLIENAGAEYGYLLLEREGTWYVEAKGSVNQEEVQTLQAISIQDPANAPLPVSVINYVARTKENVVLNDARHEGPFIRDPYIVQNQPQSLLCFPLINQGQLSGIVYMENYLTAGVFTPQRIETLKLLSTQAAISVENARLYTNLEDSLAQQVRLTKAYGRFVPREFLYALGKESILDVKLGDQIQRDMTVLFADIRSFTSISETMSPQENFRFLNDYLEQVSPIIRQYNGFIDKYVGDAIMALFGHEPSEAIKTALALHQKVAEFNQAGKGYPAIRIGISLHYGRMMLGTVGEMERMDGTVISDAVNVAARLEDLNKVYGTNIILSAETLSQLSADAPYQVRSLGKLLVRGKKESIQVYELLDGLPEPIRTQKEESKSLFEQALQQYELGQLAQAEAIFARLTTQYPDDQAAVAYLQRCQALQRHGLSTPWDITEWS